jgi:hypothetical protein
VRLAFTAYRAVQSPPAETALGQATRSYNLGSGLVLLSWRDAPGVRVLERAGTTLGWIEQGIIDGVPGSWVAVIDGRLVTDADDGQPLLSATPDDALTLLRHALDILLQHTSQ